MWNWLGVTDDKKTVQENQEKSSDKEAEVKSNDTAQTTSDLKGAASSIGNYLYTFASTASKTASKTATKLKETVDEKLDKGIVGDFSRENEKFIRENEARRIEDAVPPWVGYHEESTMKSQILALSADERNFLRDPPSGVDYQFELSQMMPVAMAALKEDDDLNAMRFKLVPKRVKEERFWRNYFYRVTLIKQSTQLSTMADLELRSSSSESLSSKVPEIVTTVTNTDTFHDVSDIAESPSNHEFASDAFQINDEGLSEEEKKQMLGVEDKVDSNTSAGQTSVQPVGSTGVTDIDRELQDELESFELVNDNIADADDENWEKELEDMLELDDDIDIKS